jgi:hypothetical protein
MNMRTLAICLLICTVLASSFAHADGYQSVQIIAPEPEATVHDNNGNLAVRIKIVPPLRAAAGDRLAILLDGKTVAGGAAQSYELTAIDRGSHTLQVRVKTAEGRVLVTSPPVKFHMWRASRLFRDRAK